MRIQVGAWVLTASLLLSACNDSAGPTGPAKPDQPPESAGHQVRDAGLETQDLRTVPVLTVDRDTPRGAPPRIPWSVPPQPDGPGRVVHPAVNPVDDAGTVPVRLRPAEPAPRHGTCWSLLHAHDLSPSWTRCYTWGRRPADGLYAPVLSPDGRWAVDLLFTGGTVLLDTRTGRVVQHLAHPGRAQRVAFEDPEHYLVVVTREPAPDAFPVLEWIVRCDLDGACERATEVVPVRAYATLGFPRSRP